MNLVLSCGVIFKRNQGRGQLLVVKFTLILHAKVMNSNGVVILNLVVALAVIGIFLWGRRGKGPSRLDLSRGNSPYRKPAGRLGSQSSKAPVVPGSNGFDSADSRAKALNILFQFQGRTYDAFQVLELPGGASLQEVREKYEVLVRASTQKPDLLKAAYEAICLRG